MGVFNGGVPRARTLASSGIPGGAAGATADHAIQSLLTGKLPVLVVNSLLRIIDFNASAAEVFPTLDGGIRFLRDLELDRGFIGRVREALRLQEPAAIRLRAGRHTHHTAIAPYLDGLDRRALILFHELTTAERRADLWNATGARSRRHASFGSAALDCLPAPIAIIDSDGLILATNRSWTERAHSGSAAGAGSLEVGSNYLVYCAALEGECAASAEATAGLLDVLQGERGAFSSRYACHRGAETRWFDLAVSPIGGAAGRRQAMLSHVDVTAEVRQSEEQARRVAALQSAASALFIVDVAGRLEWANESFHKIHGYSPAEAELSIPGMVPGLTGGSDFAEVLAACQRSRSAWTGVVNLRNRRGESYAVEQTINPVPDATGEISHFVIAQEDLTHQRHAQRHMMYMAEHDDLTGLLNRKSFQERLRLSIEQHRSTERQLAVLFIDLDRFKGANEALGHAAGDKILLETAQRLRGMLGETDALARFGGDEFVLLASRCGGRAQVAQRIERTLAALRRPVEVDGQTYSIRATIGAAIFPALGATHEDLIRNASLAMERAKSESQGAYRFYDRELETEWGERVSIERELDGSRGTRSLWIAYQPQWDVKTGTIQGAESLLRWDPAAARGIPMGKIVSIAEESGLILPIGQWVVKKALAQLQDWQTRVSPGLGLAINLSAVQLHQQDVSALFRQAMRGWKVAPAALKVEITESVLLRNSRHVTKALTALHEAGVGLVLDDFGTGYSSLNHLRQFPIESVKIDVSFVRGIGHCRQDEAIVNGIVQLAHSLGLTAVAEGVETAGQLDYLRSIGCDSAQGFLVSPAVRPYEFEQLLAANRAAAPSIPRA